MIVAVDDQNFVLELKSIGSYGFKLLDGPKEEHIHQLQLCMHFFNIHNGILLYENKDNHQLKEFEVSYEAELAESLIEKLQQVMVFIRDDKLPQKPSFPKDLEWRCKYCGFRKYCSD